MVKSISMVSMSILETLRAVRNDGTETFRVDSEGNVSIKANSFHLVGTDTNLADKNYVDTAIGNANINLTQDKVFNALTNNGQTQGIYLENSKIYINGEYIKAKSISGDKISAGVITATNGKSTINLDNGAMNLGNTTDASYLQWTGSDLNIKAKNISIGSSSVATSSDVTSAVNTAVGNIQIGGRNLIIRNTETKNYYIGTDGSLSKAEGYGVSDYIKVDSGESLAFSKKDSTTTDDYFRWAWYGNDKTYMNRTPNNSNKFIWVVPSGAAYVRISYPLDCYPKVERGTKHTDWTPAPEDVDSSVQGAITTSKEYTNSQINSTKDAIELSVSNTYETKTNVSSKVSSTLTSAKQYADTKKSEAISTASSDATSKANNALSSAKSYTDTAKNDLNTAIGKKANSADVYTKTEVYTKSQTDSQIKVAKDSINLGVSQTYETKTNVTSKVNGAISTASNDATTKANNALNSAKSYADTKKSEAITSANNTLNSTIANYYTKSQTDSQIKVAKDSITQSVASTYETNRTLLLKLME